MNTTSSISAPLKSNFGDLRWWEKTYMVILMIWTIGSSGSPVFIRSADALLVGFVFFSLLGINYWRRNIHLYLRNAFFFGLILLLHYLYFGSFYLNTAILQILVLLQAVFTVAIIGTHFIEVYLRVMFVIAIISLVFFVPILVYPPALGIILSASPIKITMATEVYGWEQVSQNILIMNFNSTFEGLRRNSGPFWEPAVYSSFLLIALVLSTLQSRSVFSKRSIVFLLATLSTFSTTAYLATGFFVFLYYLLVYKDPVFRLISLVSFFIISIIIYFNVEFLGKKIENEIKSVKFDALYQGGNSRISSAYLDFIELGERPFYVMFGRGAHPEYRYGTEDKQVLRINGITDQMSRWGVFFFLFFFYNVKRSTEAIARYYGFKRTIGILFFVTILISAFSEVLFQFGFFWTFFYLYVVYEGLGQESPEQFSPIAQPA
ncbi:hypothetical protein KJS94_07025 [Flavihumibacter rivuli]|uniref:hypothetical protein n=1 Tax=Flavihumibacter rivuli TaxID=2838156 RepID=UPI001BDDD5BE|nr:hypothetical protein [Flavihumibacter rivuli]ULQ57951.1 hypothetical protein KJS94_07025 [Flavihumibacter rivuli]